MARAHSSKFATAPPRSLRRSEVGTVNARVCCQRCCCCCCWLQLSSLHIWPTEREKPRATPHTPHSGVSGNSIFSSTLASPTTRNLGHGTVGRHMFSHNRCDPVRRSFFHECCFAHRRCQIPQASPSLMADMKYEEVYNASIAAWSWDRHEFVAQKANIIYCTHNEKVQRIRTDASPFTHGDVAATEHIIFVFPGAGVWEKCCPTRRERSLSDRVTQMLQM